METNQDRINRLQEQLNAEKNAQANCRHRHDKSVWGEPFQKAFQESEEYLTGEYDKSGVDR